MKYDEEEIENNLAGIQVDADEYKLCHVIRNLASHGINLTAPNQSVEIFCFVKHYEESFPPFYHAVHPYDVEDGSTMSTTVSTPPNGLGYVRIEVHDKGQGLADVRGHFNG